MDQIIKFLTDLGVQKINQWKFRGPYDNKINYCCGFKHKKTNYAISTSGISYVFSKLSKRSYMTTYVYEGYSLEELKDAIRKEVSEK